MRSDNKSFSVREGDELDLNESPTKLKRIYKLAHDYEECLADCLEKLNARRGLRYARDRYALPLIWQAIRQPLLN